MTQLSGETFHASTVAIDGRAVVILGASGAGKSDVSLQLIDAGAILVSDDQTLVQRDGQRLLASAPTTIAGKIEVRGLGIIELDHVENVPVALLVELTSDIERLPDDRRHRQLLGLDIPVVSIDARSASAPAKVRLALDHFGLSA